MEAQVKFYVATSKDQIEPLHVVNTLHQISEEIEVPHRPFFNQLPYTKSYQHQVTMLGYASSITGSEYENRAVNAEEGRVLFT